MAQNERTSGVEVIEQARQVWGDVTAQAVLGHIIETIVEAKEAIAPPEGIDVLQIQIADIPLTHPGGVPATRMAGLHTKRRGFSLLLDVNSPNEVLELTKAVVFHETARVYVFQHRMSTGVYKNNDERSTLDTFVEDGMVVCAVESLVDPDERPDLDKFMSYDLKSALIESWISKFISMGSEPTNWDEIMKIRFGDTQFDRPGYRVGHAIVRSAMDALDLTPSEMLKQSPQFYAEHAQRIIED